MLVSGYGALSDDEDAAEVSSDSVFTGPEAARVKSGPAIFHLPIKRPVPVNDSADEPALKKLKTSMATAKSIFEVLPQPRAPQTVTSNSTANRISFSSVPSVSRKITAAPPVQVKETGVVIEDEKEDLKPVKGDEADAFEQENDDLQERGEDASRVAHDIVGPSFGVTMPSEESYEAYPEIPDAYPPPNPNVDLYSSSPSGLQYQPFANYAQLPPVSVMQYQTQLNSAEPLEKKWAELHGVAEDSFQVVNAAQLTDMGSFTPTDKAQLERMQKIGSKLTATAASKRTGHISHLMMEAEAAELLAEEQKAAARLIRKETRSRYGW